MNRDQYLPETITAANELTERWIAEKVAAGTPLAKAQMDATYEVNQYLLMCRAMGAEI